MLTLSKSFSRLAVVLLFALTSPLFAAPPERIDLGTLQVETDYDGTLPDALPPLRVNVLEAEGSARENELRIAYLGSTVMERASVHGYLEAELTRRWPERNIIFRNLAWPGDDVSGAARVGFGPGEERQAGWQPPKGGIQDYGFRKMLGQIQQARPDVLLIGYGSNVAFEGEEGLAKFRAGLERLLDAVKPTGVKVILLTPPPREPRPAPWPDMRKQNELLQQVAFQISRTGTERGIPVVGVYREVGHRLSAMEKLRRLEQEQAAGKRTTERRGTSHLENYARGAESPLTDNGIQLNEAGFRLWARIIVDQLIAPQSTWRVKLNSGGPDGIRPMATDVGGARIEQLHRNRYGLRMLVRDDRLPSPIPSSVADERLLQVTGLAKGSYALDIDGQRVVRGTAEEWAKGIVVDQGPHVDQAEQLRQAIIEKNRLFFYGFRPQNETYIYLFRRHERGHHEGEMSQFAALAGRAEAEIMRLRKPPARFYELVREANYNEYSVPQKEVEPDLAAEMAAFTVADDLEVSLFASDPMIANPININWDERGRMWVATSSIYPHLAPGQLPDDRIVILEDIDRDGKADKSTVFADNLLIPHSAIMSDGGVYITQSTDLLYMKDTDGDDRADEKQVIFTGFGNADMHHTIHSLRWGPGGDLYFHQAIYINSHIETPWGIKNLHGSGLWRFRPDAMRLSVVSRGLVNPWGNAFDSWGQTFSTDGAGGGGIAYSFPGSAFTSAKGVARVMRSLNPGRPKECGLEITSGRHLDESWQNQFITADFRANQVVRYQLSESGSGYRSRLMGNVLSSSHRSFRPVDVKMGPDGAIYVVDWYSPIIQHGEVDFHHPQRDRRHGRIWRLTAKNRPTLTPPKLVGASIDELLEMLKLPEAWTRDQARRLLREQGADKVVPRLDAWIASLDGTDPDYDRHQLEALWIYQGLRHPNETFLRRVFVSPDHRARAAAVRVALDWLSQIPDGSEYLDMAAADAHPQVRLEAVNALRDVPSISSARSAIKVLDHPLDESLEYALWLTMRELAPHWLPELQGDLAVLGSDPRRAAFALTAIGGQASLGPIRKLIADKRTTDEQKAEMLAVLSQEGGVTVLGMVIDELQRLHAARSPQTQRVLDALVRASRSRGAKPKNAAAVAKFLQSSQHRLAASAAELTGNWQIREAVPRLAAVAGAADAPASLRNAAAVALAHIEGTGADSNVRLLASSERPLPVRISAYAAWSLIDPVAAAKPVAELLSAAKSEQAEQYSGIFEAFLARQRADVKLAEALEGQELSAAMATVGIRAAGESGRRVPQLVATLTTAGKLTPITGMPQGEELAKLMTAIEEADPHRGEAIFRRASLTCVQCHAIGNAGGRVGPDLSSLGGSVQPGKLLESILAPSATIKEGYQSVSLFDVNGRVTTGVVTRDSNGSVTMRDGKDRLHCFAADEIDELEPNQLSLMPEGLTQALRQDELADLVKFLSQLGRPGDFQVPTTTYLRDWNVLLDDATSRQLIDDPTELLKTADRLSWQSIPSRVDGSLPLEEVAAIGAAPGESGRSVLSIVLELPSGSTSTLRPESLQGVRVLLNGKPIEPAADGSLTLASGVNDLLFFVDRAEGLKQLRVALEEK